jgi:hypothetical protein
VVAVSLQVKQQEHEDDHSPSSSGKVRNVGAIPSFLHATSWHDVSLIKPWDSFTFTWR